MVTTLILVRHCESAGNITEIFQGHLDGIVTPKGYRQLEYLKERCKDIPFDAMYSSPLIRAKETARYANFYHNLPINIRDGLTELYGGKAEGKRWNELSELFPEQFYHWNNDYWNFRAPGGESVSEMYERMVKTVTDIVEQNRGKTIGIFTHGGAVRAFMCYAKGIPLEETDKVLWYDNTSITTVEVDENNKMSVISENDCLHIANTDAAPHAIWWGNDTK